MIIANIAATDTNSVRVTAWLRLSLLFVKLTRKTKYKRAKPTKGRVLSIGDKKKESSKEGDQARAPHGAFGTFRTQRISSYLVEARLSYASNLHIRLKKLTRRQAKMLEAKPENAVCQTAAASPMDHLHIYSPSHLRFESRVSHLITILIRSLTSCYIMNRPSHPATPLLLDVQFSYRIINTPYISLGSRFYQGATTRAEPKAPICSLLGLLGTFCCVSRTPFFQSTVRSVPLSPSVPLIVIPQILLNGGNRAPQEHLAPLRPRQTRNET